MEHVDIGADIGAYFREKKGNRLQFIFIFLFVRDKSLDTLNSEPSRRKNIAAMDFFQGKSKPKRDLHRKKYIRLLDEYGVMKGEEMVGHIPWW